MNLTNDEELKLPSTKNLPVLQNSKVCEACGHSFACEISLSAGCWCSEVRLSDETRQALRVSFKGCLCRACLEKAEALRSAAPTTHD